VRSSCRTGSAFSQWWTLVERYRPTWINVVPTIIAYLCNGPALTTAQAEACRGIRFGRAASAPLPPEQHRLFENRFGISVIEAMGLTECASIAFTNPLDPASAAIRLGGTATWYRGAGRGGGWGGVGRWRGRVRSNCAARASCSGYYKDPDATAQTLSADGWFATG
jgi:long-chain acyl-CoA synthetase